jgi:signal transduction histidine kinase
MPHENISETGYSEHDYPARLNTQPSSKQATLLTIGRLFSHPLITTFVSIFASVTIYVLLHLIYSQPFLSFELMLPVVIPLLVAFPISKMFQFFTKELEYSNQSLSQANTEIVAQKQELEELNKSKLKLFSIIAHDLRSPVALLHSYLDFLQETGMDSDDVIKMLPSLAEQVNTTMQLMDNLLKWSNTQMHGIRPSLSKLDLAALVTENASLFKAQLARKNITLHIENPAVMKVLADPDMLRLVLRNLTANAIKFTPENGDIWIKTSTDADSVFVTVRDSGVGISEADQQKLFRSDLHHTTPGTNKETGTGLGLLLCKQFIEKHHGKIWVDSKVGEGSRFNFSLPKTA